MKEIKTHKTALAELNNLIDYARASDNVYLLNKLLFIMECLVKDIEVVSHSTITTTYPTF